MLSGSGRGRMSDRTDALRTWIHDELAAGGHGPCGPFAVTKAVAVYEVEDLGGARFLGSMWENFCEWDSGLLSAALCEIEGCDADD